MPETAVAVERKAPFEVVRRATLIKSTWADSMPVRERIRDIMNGGQAGVKALLVNVPKNNDTLPTANLMLSGVTRLAQKLGQAPDTRVEPPSTDSEPARKAAERRERIVNYYDDQASLELQLPQVGRWLPGYGFAAWVVREHIDAYGYRYPHLELRDSFDCFPGEWGADQHPPDCLFERSATREALVRLYGAGVTEAVMRAEPSSAQPRRGGSGGLFVPTSLRSAGWEGAKAEAVNYWEYYDTSGCWLMLPGGDILDFIPNPLPRPQFVVAKRYSFDRLQGQFDQVIGLLAMMAKLSILSMIATEDNVFSPIIVNGRMDAPFRRGRNAVNKIEGGTAQLLQSNLPYQMFQEINRIEREVRVTSGYSPQADGESPTSWATGKGLAELSSGADQEVREYQLVMRHALQRADRLRLEWDELAYPDETKPLRGEHRGAAYVETYRPRVAIKGHYRTKRHYGVMAGFDDQTAIVGGLQLLGARVISRQTLQENLSGIENITRENERITAEQATETLLGAIVSGQPLDPRAALTMIALLPASDLKTELQRYWTPEGPEPTPEEAAMIEGPAPTPGNGLPEQPPPVQTVLSMLRGDGQTMGGSQTVARL